MTQLLTLEERFQSIPSLLPINVIASMPPPSQHMIRMLDTLLQKP